jgi:hypothetical protein
MHSLFPERLDQQRMTIDELREVYQIPGVAVTPLQGYVFTFELLAGVGPATGSGSRIGSAVSRIDSAEGPETSNFKVPFQDSCLVDYDINLWDSSSIPACFTDADTRNDLQSAGIQLRVWATDATTPGLDTVTIYEGGLDEDDLGDHGEFGFELGCLIPTPRPEDEARVRLACCMKMHLAYASVPALNAEVERKVMGELNGYDDEDLDDDCDGKLLMTIDFTSENNMFMVVDKDLDNEYDVEWPHTDFTPDEAVGWALADIFKTDAPSAQPGAAGTIERLLDGGDSYASQRRRPNA